MHGDTLVIIKIYFIQSWERWPFRSFLRIWPDATHWLFPQSCNPPLLTVAILSVFPGIICRGLHWGPGSEIWRGRWGDQGLLCAPCSPHNDCDRLRSNDACSSALGPSKCQYSYHFFDLEHSLCHSPQVIRPQRSLVLQRRRRKNKRWREMIAIVVEGRSDGCPCSFFSE